MCAVDVLVYRVYLEKLSAHGDVRRPQIPNVTVQLIDVLGKVQKNNHLAKTEIFDILGRSFLSIGNLCVALDLKVEVS